MKTLHVVAAIICDDFKQPTKIFATQRGYGEFKDGWEFPGGKIEQGETREEALIRECREELDITIEPLDIFMELTHEYPDLTINLTLFNAVIKDGSPKKLEHADIRWITPKEIPLFDFCPADKEILNELMKDNRQN